MMNRKKQELCSRLLITAIGKLILEGDTVTDSELIGKVYSAVYHQCQRQDVYVSCDEYFVVAVDSSKYYRISQPVWECKSGKESLL